MQLPIEITFRDVPKDDAVEDLIRQKAHKLETVCDHISSCRVAVEKPHKRRQTGNPYHVRINLTVPPGHELTAACGQEAGDPKDDVFATVRLAFEACQRQLKELVERQRNEVKSHPEQEMAAIVVKLFRKEGYGFIKTLNGREYYFHRNSVLNDDFDRLQVGTGVQFDEGSGDQGPQASSVRIVNKRGVRTGRSPDSAMETPLGWDEKS